MNAKPTLPRPASLTFASACVAAVIAVALLGGVTGLFQSRGVPMAELAEAERACAAHDYVSDREQCMRERIAAAHGARLARR